MHGGLSAVMRVIPGVLLCCLLALAGQALGAWARLPVPGAVIGLFAYLGLLSLGDRIGWSQPGATLLLRWLGALIVPALIGVVDFVDKPGFPAMKVIFVLVATTIVTAAATAATFRFVSRRSAGGDSDG